MALNDANTNTALDQVRTRVLVAQSPAQHRQLARRHSESTRPAALTLIVTGRVLGVCQSLNTAHQAPEPMLARGPAIIVGLKDVLDLMMRHTQQVATVF